MAQGNTQTRGQGRNPDFPRLLGERLCLHFANTVEAPISHQPEEFLTGYDAVARWAAHAGVLSDDDTRRLIETAAAQPDRATEVFERALALRAAVTATFGAIARGGPPADDDLALIRSEHVTALAHARLGPAGDGFGWSWPGVRDALDRPLWPVAFSAVEVLVDGDLDRIRQCPGASDCGWLFYDTSRSGRRRWCSMEGCGSRVKMRRHYAAGKERAGRPLESRRD